MYLTKFKSLIEKSIHTVFLFVALACAFFTLIHFPQYNLHFNHSIIKTLLFAGISTIIFKSWEFLLKNKNSKTTLTIYLITCIILLPIQILLFLKIASPIGWDVFEVVNSAEFGIYNGEYFVKYPNNLTLQTLLSVYLKATSFITFLSPLRKLILLNLFFVDASILMAILTAKKVYGQKAADRIFICAVLLIAFHPTLSVVYSDTIAMPFPIGTLCFFIHALCSHNTAKKTIFYTLSISFGVIGYLFKPTALIMLISISIFSVLRFKKTFLKKIVLIPLLISILLSTINYSCFSYIKQTTYNELKLEFPNTKSRSAFHYIALGLCAPDEESDGYGSWNEKEVKWMQTHIKHDNYTQEAIEHIQNKLINFGIVGYIQHLANKLIWAGTDGTFFYGNEGEFHLEEQAPPNTLRGKLQNAFYTETDLYQNLFSSWWQGVWLFIWLRLVLVFFQKQHNTYGGIAKLSILGLFLFLLLFENRSRYLFLYLPVFLFAAEHNDTIKSCFALTAKILPLNKP